MKLSIIIPAYNAEETIGWALESVLRQTVLCSDGKDSHRATEGAEKVLIGKDGLEILVIDDCSPDNTVEIVEKHLCDLSVSARDNLHLLRLDKNSGPAAARNRGVWEASRRAAEDAEGDEGHWIAFLDADDMWLPEKLEVQLKAAKENPEVAMWCAETITTGEEYHTESQRTQSSNLNNTDNSSATSAALREIKLQDFAVANPVATSTVLVKKSVLEDIGGFDEQFKGPEDYDLWMRIADKHKIVKINQPLSRYRTESGSLSMDDRKFLPEVLRVIDKAYGENGVMQGRNKRKAVAFQHLDASWMASERGAAGRALGLWLRSVLVWPFSFAPENPLPWGRVKLLFRFLKSIAQRRRDRGGGKNG